MKKIFYLVIVVIVACAFALPANDPFVTKVLQNLLMRVKVQPQEKLYLHTDRDHYQAEDKIWFRAYLVDAATHTPSENSRYIYVELVNRRDSVFNRVKIRGVDSVYAGNMPIPKNIQQGEYFLRAYSYWMQNQGEDFLFKKKIRILNVDDTKVVTLLTYVPDGKGESLDIQFKNSRDVNYSKAFIYYFVDGVKKIKRANEQGVIRIDGKDIVGKREIIVGFEGEEPMSFERRICIPERNKDYDVQFFPEGGDLLTGSSQVVAFKAIGADGLGKEVEGAIYDEQGEFVQAVKSVHRGMGVVEFKPEIGKKYHAEIHSVDSVKKRIELPTPKPDGLALKLWTRDSVLNYMLLAGDSTVVSEDLYLAALSRGVPVLCAPLTRTMGRFPLKSFPEGIVNFVLMDSKYNIYSQRLCFVRGKNRPELSVKTSKPAYVARDLANLSVDVVAENGKPLSGSFSVAITDDVQHEKDSLQEDHIVSNLLLTSDLKGYIEDPGFYFRDVNRSTERFLDILMLTQGWSRFNLPEVIRGELQEPPYYLEKGQTVSGRVKNFWGKQSQNANLVVFSTTGIMQIAQADTSGHFLVDGISFPEGTQFVVQAQSNKGRKNVEVILDQDEFVKPKINSPYGIESVKEDGRFYDKFSKDYFYENGLKVYVLDEVTVKRKKTQSAYSSYDAVATFNLDSVKLSTMLNLSMREVLEQIPGVRVDEIEQTVLRSQKTLSLFVNDLPEDFSYIMSFLRPIDLLSISYLDPIVASSLLGSDYRSEGVHAANGAIIITTSPNYVRTGRLPRQNLAITALLGYQKEAEFYTPRYDVDSVRRALANISDKRPTIYWNPNVRTDISGKAEFSFFTSDSYGPYSLIIEGILDDGTVCRKEQRINLKLPR